MSVLASWRFWGALVLTAGVLSVAGLMLARALVPEPPQYYRATYYEFALPPGWTVEREGAETICTPPGGPPADAIIILAEKPRSSEDQREAYRQYLRQPRTWTTPDGHEVTSEVVYVRDVTIGGYEWIDGRQKDSEIPGYDTRYLVTTTSHMALAITFSAGRPRFDQRNEEFEASIESLVIYQSPSPFN